LLKKALQVMKIGVVGETSNNKAGKRKGVDKTY
jgi:hypothetical protein